MDNLLYFLYLYLITIVMSMLDNVINFSHRYWYFLLVSSTISKEDHSISYQIYLTDLNHILSNSIWYKLQDDFFVESRSSFLASIVVLLDIYCIARFDSHSWWNSGDAHLFEQIEHWNLYPILVLNSTRTFIIISIKSVKIIVINSNQSLNINIKTNHSFHLINLITNFLNHPFQHLLITKFPPINTLFFHFLPFPPMHIFSYLQKFFHNLFNLLSIIFHH